MGKRRRKNKERILELASEYRESAEPRCSHFGTCGGCLFQDIEYSKQLHLKTKFLNEACSETLPRLEAITPAPTPFEYRNRMDFVAAFGKRGLRKRGSFKEVFDITNCPLMQVNSNSVWQSIQEKLHQIEDYDYLVHKGFLRYTILRQGFYSSEVMLNFVISRNENKDLFSGIIESLDDRITSSSLLLNDTLTDTSYAPVCEVLKGGSIKETFDTCSYEIGPNTFFQSNSAVALTMYQKIKEFVKGTVLDLYCGVGSISLFIADACDSVTGVDIIADSIESARMNMKLNNISNASFVAQDARHFIRENQNKFNTLILDPPRSGMNPRMYKYIPLLAPERIIYMSCNPVTFKEDFNFLKDYYTLDYYEAFDMFPQTPHTETLALLLKK